MANLQKCCNRNQNTNQIYWFVFCQISDRTQTNLHVRFVPSNLTCTYITFSLRPRGPFSGIRTHGTSAAACRYNLCLNHMIGDCYQVFISNPLSICQEPDEGTIFFQFVSNPLETLTVSLLPIIHLFLPIYLCPLYVFAATPAFPLCTSISISGFCSFPPSSD